MIQRFADVTRAGFYKERQISTLLKQYKKPVYDKSQTTKVKSITPIDGTSDVYCLREDIRRTVTVGGLVARRCGEIFLESGESCNLAEVFLPNIDSEAEMHTVCQLLYKTQKAVTSLPYPFKRSQDIVRRNRRLGLGTTGIMQATPEQLAYQDPAYRALCEFDIYWSEKLGIPPSKKRTANKPSGSLSLLPFVTAGVGPAGSTYMIRRVRVGSDDPLVQECRDAGYLVQYDIGLDGVLDHRKVVVDFPCRYPDSTITADQVTAISQLEVIVRQQTEWSDNAVSATVVYTKEEFPAIKEWLAENYETKVKSVSFLPKKDHGFKLPPQEPITKEVYESMVSNLKEVKLGSIMGSTELNLECEGGVCPIK